MKRQFKSSTSTHLLLLAVLLAASSALGGPANEDAKEAPAPIATPAPSCVAPSDTEFRLGLPGWVAGVSGDTGVKGIVTSSDVNSSELPSHLTHVPIVLSADLRYKRWEFFGDGQYVQVGTSATLPGLLFTHANVHVRAGIAEAFLGYRFINCDRAALSLFAGARYNYLGADLSIFDNGDARLAILRQLLGIPGRLNFSDSTEWVDPVLGTRGKIRVWKALTFYAQGDVGGFNANSDSAFELVRQRLTIEKRPIDSSDWSYQVQGGLEVQVARHFWTKAGWRYLKHDYVSGGFTNKTELSGPYLEVGINF